MTLYYVSSEGVDSQSRDGLSWETAWASLAYASDRVPAGENTIQLSSGTFVATETAMPKSGVTIAGGGRDGENATRIIASPDWELSPNPSDETAALNEYLIAIQNGDSITIQDIVFASTPEHRITGAVYVIASDNITVRDTTIRDFRWSGIHLELSENLSIYNNYIENASIERFKFSNGSIRTRFIKNSEIQFNTIVSTEGQGYGYKGGGHENVRITHNIFNIDRGFAIESAHENEFGVEIAYNYANQPISIPRGAQGANPADRGYDYTFWMHHNLLTDSYTIEGPRNHLRLSHNYIRINDTGGNVYTQHGGINNGPVWIHNNVVENVDRGLVWMNQGLAENIFLYNNTVTLADAGDRVGAILTAPNRDGLNESLNNWVVQNNIFIAPDSQPRELYPDNGIGNKITATNNILMNVTNVPDSNDVDVVPGFTNTGDRPFPFYAPAVVESLMVDRGVDVGLPFLGTAPDIGAYEWGEDSSFPVNVALLDIETLVNGVDADTADLAIQVAAGELVTWTYEVTNIGTTTFAVADLSVIDDRGLIPLWDATSDLNGDGLLQPEETWIYTASAPAEDLTVDDSIPLYRNVGSVLAPGGTQNTAGTLATTIVVDADASYYRNPLSTGLFFSVDDNVEIAGLAVADEDIVQFDGTDFSLLIDSSDVGLGSGTLSAFDVISDTEILLSFKDPIPLDGVGNVDDSDVVKFTASSLGETTSGTFSLYLDGSDVNLTRNGEDIDGLSLLADGSLLISTKGVVRTGTADGADEDVLQFIPTTLGEDTAGSWAFFFDGSDVGLEDNGENINAFSLTSTGQLALSVDGEFQVTGQSGNNADVTLFTPSSTGETTTGIFDPALFFDGSEFGLFDDISGVDLLGSSASSNANLPPDAQDDTAATSADTPLLIEALSNDEDEDGDVLSVVAVNEQSASVGIPQTLNSGALITLNSDSTLTYDPNGQFNSLVSGDIVNDIFDYTVRDTNGGESSATVVVSVVGVGTLINTPPIASDDKFSTEEALPISGNVLVDNGSGPDIDPDGDALAMIAVEGDSNSIDTTVMLSSGALLTLASSGQFIYEPNGQFEALAEGESTIDSFDYTLSDGNGDESIATVEITILGIEAPLNTLPLAADDSLTTGEDTAISFNVLLDNGNGSDSDPDGDSLTVVAINGVPDAIGTEITLPSGALLTTSAEGQFTYEPNGQFEDLATGEQAIDAFDYSVSDGNGGVSMATVTVQVNGADEVIVPVPTGFFFSVDDDVEVAGLAIANEDIVQFDGIDFSLLFDGSDVGLGNATLDAFDVISGTEILLSFKDPVTIHGLGDVDDSDVVKFTASNLGETTAGTFSLYLDGSDIGLTRNGEDIDGLSLLADDSLLISTKGVVRTSSADGSDEDILQFTPTTLGEDTVGNWSVFFDGSDVGLDGNGENINAFGLTSTGQMALSVEGEFQVVGQSGSNADVALFTPSSTGETTTGSFDSALLFDGSDFGLSADISGIDLL